MARNRGSTLSLPIKAEPIPEPVKTPVFDPERLAVQSYSGAAQGFIQGKNFFGPTGNFIRELPESEWYITTPEQEENNRRARARARQLISRRAVDALNTPALPDKLLSIARENTRAFAAEALAE
jgi:hypothetical protein